MSTPTSDHGVHTCQNVVNLWTFQDVSSSSSSSVYVASYAYVAAVLDPRVVLQPETEDWVDLVRRTIMPAVLPALRRRDTPTPGPHRRAHGTKARMEEASIRLLLVLLLSPADSYK